MNKLFLLLILSFFSAQSFAGSCPDGSDPVKSISDDGTYFVYKCGGGSNNDKKKPDAEKKPAKTATKTTIKNTTSFKAKPSKLEISGKYVGQFNMKKLSENSNPKLGVFSTITNTFDVNQDGHDDLIVGNTNLNSDDRHQQNEFAKPVILFWDNNIKEYVVDDNVQKTLPLMYYPRRIHGSINPKTGLTHLFIADTGFDLFNYDFSKGIANLPPNCGAQNHLITYDPSSGKASEIQLPKLYDYSHGLATADLNGDQITDYVLLNSPYIKFPSKCSFNGMAYTNESYILYSNKNGSFDRVNIELNYNGHSKAPTITSGIAIVDENNDTFLLVGMEGSGSGIYALKQDSKASFTETSRVNAPAIMREGSELPAYSEVLYADVDLDGLKEVVASINTQSWKGRYIQLLDFSNGELRDRSEDVIQLPSNTIKTGNDWCHHLFFNEKTAWNQPILTCTNLTALSKSKGYFYTWTQNKLQLAKINSKNSSQWIRRFYPVTIDQNTVFLGNEINDERKVNGFSFFDSIVLNIVEPSMSESELSVVKEKEESVVKEKEEDKFKSEKTELFSSIKTSSAFDGIYSFTLMEPPMNGLGHGTIEINQGIVTIGKDSKGIVAPKYDSFDGRIDQNGDIKATFYFHPCNNCEDKLVVFDGNLNKKKLTGIYNDLQIYFYLTNKIAEVTKVETTKVETKVYTEKKQTLEIAIPENSRTWDYPFLAFDKYEAKGSKDYYKFQSNLKEDADVLKELKNNHKTGLISYLLFEDNKIVIDESDIPIKVQGDRIIDGLLPSHSMGKSLVSYVTGHAICEGYIKSVDERLTGWDVIENTLYKDQVLIDLLNMTAGDQEYIGERLGEEDNFLIKSKVNGNKIPLKKIMGSDLLNSKKSNPVYNYSALTTHVILNYVLHKSGDEILDKVFNDHVKVKNSVYFTKTPVVGYEQSARYSFYATRYDYLRIAKAMMDDWNNDNCVGKYLKTVYDRRIEKADNTKKPNSVGLYSRKYGGQFHFDMFGINKTRKILGMSGFAGQEILIDVDNKKIIVVNSLLKKYDWKKIVYERIKNVQPHSGPTQKIEEATKVEIKKVETSDSDPTVSKIIEVTHGDKLIVDIAEPHELAGTKIKVSLKDIDAPDATRSCPKQMELGLKVKDYVAQKLDNASSIKLTNFRKTNTKIIAQVIVDGVDLGEELVSKGYASEEYGYWKPYLCSALTAINTGDSYIDTDDEKAIFWYERSLILDPDGSSNSRSLFRLFRMYSNIGNKDKSMESLKKSASLEWVPAMEQLGSDYLNGSGVKKDSNQGKKWLKKAFDKGSTVAEGMYCGSLPKAKQKTCKF